jgi:Flp pilus assembly pilin Flp
MIAAGISIMIISGVNALGANVNALFFQKIASAV